MPLKNGGIEIEPLTEPCRSALFKPGARSGMAAGCIRVPARWRSNQGGCEMGVSLAGLQSFVLATGSSRLSRHITTAVASQATDAMESDAAGERGARHQMARANMPSPML